MPLVTPLTADTNPEVAELATFFNETLGFCPNSVLTMMRRPKIAKAFINLNMAVMDNQGRVTSALKRLIASSSHANFAKLSIVPKRRDGFSSKIASCHK